MLNTAFRNEADHMAQGLRSTRVKRKIGQCLTVLGMGICPDAL